MPVSVDNYILLSGLPGPEAADNGRQRCEGREDHPQADEGLAHT
jgi:hypothetical protein